MSIDVFTGSCLCGAVAFRIAGRIKAFYHCHCQRCRKASGTGHASNVIVALDSAAWPRGEDRLRRFEVPGARYFYTQFCADCGSPLPRIASERGVAVIPAGALDEAPELAPTGRIFQDSRAAWSCHGDGLPAWPQYPT